ncbi:DnaJ C-terminal domain-containing protein [Kribbella sp. NPDC056951]|uniref:caspase, EACC1-associated type n=1 Tax=Kribbella sp. NPDC056951 TaxID=3345978 RepID=UPI003644787E
MAGIRDALLIATGTYQNDVLTGLRSPAADADRLGAVLEDPEIGWFQVQKVLDASAGQILRAIERFFLHRSLDDLLVLHLSCHGIKDDRGNLYFAATDTDPTLLASTAVPATFLKEQMDRCLARSIVVMLDCCYSGAMLPGAKGSIGVDSDDQMQGSGRAIMTASKRTEYAWESNGVVELAPEPSLFTEAIIHGLATGEADRDHDGQIGVDELYGHVFERLRRSGAKQTPGLFAKLEYRVLLASSKRIRMPEPAVSTPDETPIWPQRRARRGQDMLLRFDVPIRELVLGSQRRLTVEGPVTCKTCKGVGTSLRSVVTRCGKCSGYGDLPEQRTNELMEEFFGPKDASAPAARGCPDCAGFGTQIENPCAECDGDGRVATTRTLTVSVPKGLYEGARIRLSGQGEVGPGGGPAGDLFLEVAEGKDPVFGRDGDDLTCTVQVPAAVAAQGGIIDVTTFEGVKRVRVPAGTATGQRLRVPSLGIPHLRAEGRGDLIVTIEVTHRSL